jgi:hypothetical protein
MFGTLLALAAIAFVVFVARDDMQERPETLSQEEREAIARIHEERAAHEAHYGGWLGSYRLPGESADVRRRGMIVYSHKSPYRFTPWGGRELLPAGSGTYDY